MPTPSPAWDPAGNPVHRLIQYLDTLAVSVARFQQCTFEEPFFQGRGMPGYDHERRCDALKKLTAEYRAVTGHLFPRDRGDPRHLAAALADAAVAYFVGHGRTEAESWVRHAAEWVAGAGMWTPETGEPTGGEWPLEKEQFRKEQDAVFHMRTVRAHLLAELARCGRPAPEAIYGRVDRAPLPPLPPGKRTISVEELLRWADEAQPSGTPPAPPRPRGSGTGEGGPPAPPGRVESPSVALVANAERARQSRERDRELRRSREDLWGEYLASFTPLRRRWFAAWRPVAEAVNAGDWEATAAALAEAAGILAEIDRATACWEDNARSWLRTAKENNSAWGCLAPVDHQPVHVSDTACWAEGVAGAGGVCAFAEHIPVVHLEDDYSRPLSVLVMLADGATAEQFTALFRAWGGPYCLRGLTAALAMALVPPEEGQQFDQCEMPADDRKQVLATALLRMVLLRLGSPRLLEVVDRYFSRRPSVREANPTTSVGVPPQGVTNPLKAAGVLPQHVRTWLRLKFLADPTPDTFPTPAGPKRMAFARFEDLAEFLVSERIDPLPNIDLMHQAGWILDLRIDIHPPASDDAPAPSPAVQRVAVRLALGPGEHRIIGIPETICEPSPDSPCVETVATSNETGGGGKSPSPTTKPRNSNKPSADRQQDILAVIQTAGMPLQRAEIVAALKLNTEGKLGHHLAWMTENDILINIPQRGYWPVNQPVPG